MKTYAPVSTIMTTHLYTVEPTDSMTKVQNIFASHPIHHVPVVDGKTLIGLVSKTDYEYLMGRLDQFKNDTASIEHHLDNTLVADIMTKRLGKLESTDNIAVALNIFLKNRFHALPIVDNGELVGIVTPFDILKAIEKEEPINPLDKY